MFVKEKTCASCKVLMPTDGNFVKLKTRYHSWCNVCRKENKRKWYVQNVEYARQVAKDWHYKNYHKCKERKVETATKWIKNNPEKYKEYAKKCYENNKAKAFAHSAKYRARKRNAVPKWLDDSMIEQIESFFNLAKQKTIETGIKHEVDHIIPLQGKTVSGLHVPWNLQVITQFENRSKRNLIKE